jgi:RNA polymerase sigma factor (sigma-70 family)
MDGRIPKLQQHDAVVFRELYDAYHEKLYFFVLKHTRSSFLAEETVQLSFIRIWEKADKLSAEADLSSQIFRIAKSVMIDLLRKENVRIHHSSQMLIDTAFEQEASDIDNRHELVRVHKAIEEMAPVRKTVFTLSRFEGYSHLSIAERLSISPKTVENHINKALRQLRRTLTSFLF